MKSVDVAGYLASALSIAVTQRRAKLTVRDVRERKKRPSSPDGLPALAVWWFTQAAYRC
jgi:hypothetical protein